MHKVDNVGTVPAAVAAYLAVQTVKPDLLINAGTAGGFKARGAGIGDIYISNKTVNHDRRIPLSVISQRATHYICMVSGNGIAGGSINHHRKLLN